MIPYGKQTIEEDDVDSIIEVLRQNSYLTTGPKVKEFEDELCRFSNKKYAIAVSNGTAALHCAIYTLDLKKEDEVIVTTMSFVASANCILYCGGKPVFADIDEETLNIDCDKIEKLITSRTKAILVVDFAGQLCDYFRLKEICNRNKLILIEDAAHSFGVSDHYPGDLVTCSFHPVKNITTGEGGAILTDDKTFADRMKIFRNHGIDTVYEDRKLHYYSMIDLGFNYRLTDFQSALGISQLKKLKGWVRRRQEIAERYNKAFEPLHPLICPLKIKNPCCYHIYILRLNPELLNFSRDQFFVELKKRNISANVHYKPIHLQPYYLEKVGTFEGLCPKAESVYNQIITIPLYVTLSDDQVQYIINSITEIIKSG